MRVVTVEEINERLSQKIKTAMKNRHWSSRAVRDEIAKQGGRVAYATIDNIVERPIKSEFHNVYWVLRVLDISMGEALDFTVEQVDERAHRMLANALRMSRDDRKFIIEALHYVQRSATPEEKTSERA